MVGMLQNMNSSGHTGGKCGRLRMDFGEMSEICNSLWSGCEACSGKREVCRLVSEDCHVTENCIEDCSGIRNMRSLIMDGEVKGLDEREVRSNEVVLCG